MRNIISVLFFVLISEAILAQNYLTKKEIQKHKIKSVEIYNDSNVTFEKYSRESNLTSYISTKLKKDNIIEKIIDTYTYQNNFLTDKLSKNYYNDTLYFEQRIQYVKDRNKIYQLSYNNNNPADTLSISFLNENNQIVKKLIKREKQKPSIIIYFYLNDKIIQESSFDYLNDQGYCTSFTKSYTYEGEKLLLEKSGLFNTLFYERNIYHEEKYFYGNTNNDNNPEIAMIKNLNYDIDFKYFHSGNRYKKKSYENKIYKTIHINAVYPKNNAPSKNAKIKYRIKNHLIESTSSQYNQNLYSYTFYK